MIDVAKMCRRPAQRDEAGSITPLIMGLFVIAALIITTGIAISAVQLERMRLFDAADGAALRAANALDVAAYDSGVAEAVPINNASVEEAAVGYLNEIGLPRGVESWQLAAGTGAPDGQTAVVVLTGQVSVPLVGDAINRLGGSVTVTVTSRARAELIP